ncbi:MAG: hypothetical protein ACI9OU_000810, partial [Candidatus Promineifilaceae bacterium]
MTQIQVRDNITDKLKHKSKRGFAQGSAQRKEDIFYRNET